MRCEVIATEYNTNGDVVFIVRQGAGQAFPYRVVVASEMWMCGCNLNKTFPGTASAALGGCEHIVAALPSYARFRERIAIMHGRSEIIRQIQNLRAGDFEVEEQAEEKSGHYITDEKRKITRREKKE